MENYIFPVAQKFKEKKMHGKYNRAYVCSLLKSTRGEKWLVGLKVGDESRLDVKYKPVVFHSRKAIPTWYVERKHVCYVHMFEEHFET